MAPTTHLQEGYTSTQDSLNATPSPSNSFSDKENRQTRRTNSSRVNKRSQVQAMAPPSSQNKRRRLTDRIPNSQDGSQSQARRSQRISDKKYYDPDQDENERRKIRKGLRDLTRELHDSRAEFLKAGNDGILKTVQKANEYFTRVKQTSEAAIDSRLLVTAADLSHKKTAQLALGNNAAGLDVDEFVSKCVAFMRRGPGGSQAIAPGNTQRRRYRPSGATQGDEGDSDDEEGEPMNWDWLGRAACFQHNSRPSVSGFLLGPLSVQKRMRQVTQRRAKERIDPSRAVRPQELQEEDLDTRETADLTTMCLSINKLLSKTQQENQDAAERELSGMEPEELDEDLVHEVMDKHNVADDGGVPLFHFCINPRSFGQSVENLFYVSFLVRDGTVGISMDGRQLPTLHAAKPYAPSEAQKRGIQKHQAVFSLDFDTWRDLIEAYGITESIIPHREEEQNTTRRGWYG